MDDAFIVIAFFCGAAATSTVAIATNYAVEDATRLDEASRYDSGQICWPLSWVATIWMSWRMT